MWVIRFYLNANKNVFSETVTGGDVEGVARGRESGNVLVFSCWPGPPLSAARVVLGQVPPGACGSLCLSL